MPTDGQQAGLRHRDERRRNNRRKAGAHAQAPDAQGLVAFRCECIVEECEASVRIPLEVYRRVVDAGDQYLVRRGHHPYARYRTIVSRGLLSIEEAVDD